MERTTLEYTSPNSHGCRGKSVRKSAEFVVGNYGLARGGGFHDCHTGCNGFGAFLGGHADGSTVEDMIGKDVELVADVVVVDVNGNDLGLGLDRNAVLTEGEELHGVGGVVAKDGSLGAPKLGAHGVRTLATRGNEYLAHQAIRPLHYSDGSIVVGSGGEKQVYLFAPVSPINS